MSMGTIGFADILLFLKKRVRVIIAFTLIGAIMGFTIAQFTQTYTAGVGIQYTYEGASDQLNPMGGALNVYEVMNPALISAALKDIDSDLSVEQVRNQLAVSPVVKTTDTEAQAARIAQGVTVDVTTTNYNVSYTCSGRLGSDFAQRFLYALLRQYDGYFSRQYLDMVLIKDFMGIVDVDAMDYMEKCEYIDSQIEEITSRLDALSGKDSSFTSKTTGLSFDAIRRLYDNMRENQYKKLYANVRVGLLTKDKNLLIEGYRHRIEEMSLQMHNFSDEADKAREMVSIFYEQYKNVDPEESADTAQKDNAYEKNNIVYDYDLSLMLNTYDDMLLRGVDMGVAAAEYKHEIERYQALIDEFTGDDSDIESKADLFNSSDELLTRIADLSARYATLANLSLDDYYKATIAEYLKYIMAVEVTPGVSPGMYVLMGMAIMLLLGACTVIMYEVVSLQLAQRRFELLKTGEDGELSTEIIDNMTPIEQAFYEQSRSGFTEFYLMFQPMVRNGSWEISETLVRWDSKRHGQVLPDEFLPIAEKFRLMNRLGEWILEQACKQSITWQNDGKASPCISVNYSTQQIESQSFIDTICRIITDTRVEASNIYLEISGGGELHNVEQVAQKFVALKALGLSLTIDRFGESISSMRTLYDLPSDMVKLDRRFLSALHDSPDKNTAFLNQIISVCQERNLLICVCGVEEPWQVERLQALGIEYQQGFYFSSPLPVDAYEKRYAAESRDAQAIIM